MRLTQPQCPSRRFVSKRWFLCALVGLALVAGACGGSNGQKNSGANPTTNPASAADTSGSASGQTGGAGSSGAANEVTTALENLAHVKSFRGSISLEGDQSKGNGSLEVVGPDKVHITFNGAGQGNLELISIGNTRYTKTRGAWTRSTGGSSTLGLDPGSLTRQVLDLGTNAKVTRGASDSVSGKACQNYLLEDQKSKTKSEACIADNLPLRLIIDSSGSKVTILLSDFNANIDITAPI